MFKSEKIGFIGCGNMAEALIRGILEKRLFEKTDITCFDVSEDRLKYVSGAFGVNSAKENSEVVSNSDIIFLATKPPQVLKVINEIAGSLKSEKLLISIAAGVSIDFIQSRLTKVPVIRVMPNTPALVLSGMSALSAGEFAKGEHIEAALKVFGGVGEAIEVDEGMIDAVTALSGSGPAYVFLIIEAMADGGVRAGLPRDVALKLAAQTVLGAAKMVIDTKKHPGVLKDMVASPGGTTIEGLSVLEDNGVRGAIIEAVEAAFLKAKELSGKE